MRHNNINKNFSIESHSDNLKKVKPEIIPDLAHELGTPLTVVKETLQMILNGSCGPLTDKQVELLELSEQSIARLIRLTEGMLDTSKKQPDSELLKKEDIHINRFIEKISKSYKKYFMEKNISVKYKIRMKNPVVRANEDSLTQVLINLLSNSIKYTVPGGNTQIYVTETSTDVCFEVSNTGNWIPEDSLNKIFNKFEQLHHEKNGAGIGLYIVKNIIEKHNGKIWAESSPLKGIAFKFNLPK